MAQQTNKLGGQQEENTPVPDSTRGPRFRIELHVSCIDADGGQETLLGRCDDRGNWIPVRLQVERGTQEFNVVDLADWLSALDLVGESAFESTQAAAAAVAQMHQRCVIGE